MASSSKFTGHDILILEQLLHLEVVRLSNLVSDAQPPNTKQLTLERIGDLGELLSKCSIKHAEDNAPPPEEHD
jgi:hypothetical protein